MFVKSISGGERGSLICVTLSDENSGGIERMFISQKLWTTLSGEIAPLAQVDETVYDALRSAADKTSALREASRMIGSGEKSKCELERRLKSKKIPENAAKWAVSVLERNGYLDEESSCARIAESAVSSKHYGKRRILDFLLSHGYERSSAVSAVESIDDADYRAALDYNLKHKFPHAAESDAKERQKIYTALARLGFSASDISDALRRLREK